MEMLLHHARLLLLRLVLLTTTAVVVRAYSSFVPHKATSHNFANCYPKTWQRATTRSTTATSRTHRPSRLHMKLRVGLVGLPNVGKSSLFNALARASVAQAANFPFCTIDPNVAPVPVPSLALHALAQQAGHKRVVPATLDWVDVAGLARGAHRGEGLGNRFLGALRECTCLCHVVRAFDDPRVLFHHSSSGGDDENQNKDVCNVDPVRDLRDIQHELLRADEAHLERYLLSKKGTKTADKSDDDERYLLECLWQGLIEGIPARRTLANLQTFDTKHDADTAALSNGKKHNVLKSMGLLTLKPAVYAFNVDEVDFLLDRASAEERALDWIRQFSGSSDSSSSDDDNGDLSDDVAVALVSAELEARLTQQSPDEQASYLESVVGAEAANEMEVNMDKWFSYHTLPSLVRTQCRQSLVFTGPGVPPERSQTTRAHLIPSSSSPFSAYDLAGHIHGDIQRGFLHAEVIAAHDLLTFEDFASAKEAGKVRMEGRNFVLNEGDVVLIKWKG